MDTCGIESESTGNTLHGERLGEPWNSLEEDMSSGKQSDEDIADQGILADYPLRYLHADFRDPGGDIFDGDVLFHRIRNVIRVDYARV